jgi:hypothetical protein
VVPRWAILVRPRLGASLRPSSSHMHRSTITYSRAPLVPDQGQMLRFSSAVEPRRSAGAQVWPDGTPWRLTALETTLTLGVDAYRRKLRFPRCREAPCSMVQDVRRILGALRTS